MLKSNFMSKYIYRVHSAIIFLLILSCCQSQNESFSGVYTLSNTKNTIDTLVLFYDSKNDSSKGITRKNNFRQIIYDKKTKKLLVNNSGKWYIKGKKIEFINFYINYDNDVKIYSYSQESINSNLGSFGTISIGNKILLDDEHMYIKR